MNRRLCPALLGSILLFSFTAFAAEPAVIDLNTPRTFPVVTARTSWEARAREIREQVLVSCGLWPMPEKTPLRAHIFGRIERDGYSVEKVYFQPSPGFYLAGNLYRPLGKGRGPFPGALLPHGHWKEGRLVNNNEASVPALGISFARQGVVAFAYDMVGFNDTRFADSPTNKPFYEVHRMFGANKADQLWNISLMGLQTWNSSRALDFLESLPDVDKKRLACTGASGGGTQTFMLGAIDDRLAAQAPVVMVSHTMQGGCSCENAPGLRVEYSNMELAAAAAPRPQILVAATGDWTKMTLEVEGPAIQRIYDLFGASDRLRYVRFNFNHNYNQTSREAVYDWFGKWLLKNPDSASLKEQPHQKESNVDLRVFPDGKLPDDALQMEKFAESLKQKHDAQWRALVPRDKESFATFKQVILPAWRHTLHLEDQSNHLWVGSVKSSDRSESPWWVIDEARGDDRIFARAFGPKSKPSAVVLAPLSFKAAGEFLEDNIHPGELTQKIVRQGRTVFLLEDAETNRSTDQFANFFTTYNRTTLQQRVRNVVSACDYNRTTVILWGKGKRGLETLLAAPSAGAVVADCNRFDATRDEVLLSPEIFCPGLRNIGTFEGAAMLAAPHPLLLHNIGDKFSTDAIRATYRALGASKKLRIESRELSDDEIAEWIAKLK